MPELPRFRLSDRAARDITEIWNHIFEGSSSLNVADRVVRKVFECIEMLAVEPGAGHSRNDLTTKPLRFWSVYDYLVAYRPDTSPIEIVAVFHATRDIAALLGMGGLRIACQGESSDGGTIRRSNPGRRSLTRSHDDRSHQQMRTQPLPHP